MEQGLDDFHSETTETISTEDEELSSGSRAWRFIWDILETLVLAILLFLVINAVSARIRVDGSSMVPTLNNGQFVMVNRLAYHLGDFTTGEVKRGDVVVFQYPRDPEQEYIKRIIALPGDNVEITGGHVFVNGQQLIEPYIAADARSEGDWFVPAGHIFVLGDNRNNSQDSRSFGYVSMENVIGKAIFIYWPPPDWSLIINPQIGATTPNAYP